MLERRRGISRRGELTKTAAISPNDVGFGPSAGSASKKDR